MTDTAIQEKKPIEYYRADPERYTELKSGSFQDNVTHRIVAMFSELNPYSITPANARQMQSLARLKKARSKLQGLADLTHSPVDVDAMTDEELISAAGDGVRTLTKHMAEQFIASKNVRGLAESYSKLVDALGEEPNRQALPEQLPPGTVSATVETLMQLAHEIEQHVASERDKARSLDAEVINSDAEKWAKGEA